MTSPALKRRRICSRQPPVIERPDICRVLARFPVVLPSVDDVPRDPDALADQLRRQLRRLAESSSSTTMQDLRFADLFKNVSNWFVEQTQTTHTIEIDDLSDSLSASWQSPAVFDFPEPPCYPKPLKSLFASGDVTAKKGRQDGPICPDLHRKSLRIIATKVANDEPADSRDHTSSQRVQYLMDNITKISGYHPYLWYLMCRRPELEQVGARPRQMSKIASREWDDLQNTPPKLTLFLLSTVRFLAKHPVPAKDKNADLNSFRELLITELPTPNRAVLTSALREALANNAKRPASNQRKPRPVKCPPRSSHATTSTGSTDG